MGQAVPVRTDYTSRRFGGLRDARRMGRKREGFWRLRPCSTGLRGRKQRRSAGWTYSYAPRYYAYGYPRYRAGPYGGYRPWHRW